MESPRKVSKTEEQSLPDHCYRASSGTLPDAATPGWLPDAGNPTKECGVVERIKHAE